MNRYEEEFLICAYSLENGLLAEENLGLFPGREGEREAPRVRPVSYTYLGPAFLGLTSVHLLIKKEFYHGPLMVLWIFVLPLKGGRGGGRR